MRQGRRVGRRAGTGFGLALVAVAFASVALAPARGDRSAASRNRQSRYAGGYDAKVPRTVHIRTGLRLPNLPCGKADKHRVVSASVNLRTRPLRRSIYVPLDGECDNGKPTWAAEFQAAYYSNFLFNLHSGDRISIRIAASPSRHDRVVVSDLTEGRTRRIRGRAAAARHLDLDVGPLILRIHHRDRRSPLANFGHLRYGPTTINGRGLAAYRPKGSDLVVHGHTRVKAGPIEHGHSFALTYAPW